MTNAALGFCGPLAHPGWITSSQAVDSRPVGAVTKPVPRFPDKNLDGAVFLFRSVQEAEARARIGGTGFFVGRELAGSAEILGRPFFANYVVSNRHVVFDASACVVALNRKDGGPPDILDIDQEAWVAHPQADLAATCVSGLVDKSVHRLRAWMEHQFITEEALTALNIGVGEEVVMVGRFVNHQGDKENKPAVRFGSISMMANDIAFRRPHAPPDIQECLAVEMRSRTGFSGSPVAVYRTIATVLDDVPPDARQFFRLLGVNIGYIYEELESGELENTWLNGVIPAWKITELLNHPELLAAQRQHEEFIRQHSAELLQHIQSGVLD